MKLYQRDSVCTRCDYNFVKSLCKILSLLNFRHKKHVLFVALNNCCVASIMGVLYENKRIPTTWDDLLAWPVATHRSERHFRQFSFPDAVFFRL